MVYGRFFLLKWSECLCFIVFVSKIIVQRFLMHARFFGAYVLTFQPDFRANKVFSKKIFNEFLSLVLYFVLSLSCFFWNCNIFFLIYRSALFQIFVAAVFSTAYFFHIFAACFCCRSVFSENRFLFTSVGLWAYGISVSLCRFALYMFSFCIYHQ